MLGGFREMLSKALAKADGRGVGQYRILLLRKGA